MWLTLVPLIVGGAIVPVQLAITVLLARGAHGVRTATAWVCGRVAVTVAQGILFGFVFAAPVPSGSSGAGPIVSALLLAIAAIFIAGALKQLFARADPDAPPPKWMRALDSVGAGRAFLLGAGLMAIGAKFWVFTLSAVGAISDERLGVAASIGVFAVFVVLSNVTHIAIIAVVACAPRRSEAILTAMSDWLARHNRVLVIVIGLVFGVWFAIKGLSGLGVF